MTCRSASIRLTVPFLACALLLSGCATGTIADFDNSAVLENPDKYLAFVGRKIEFVRFDPAEDDPETTDDLADGDTIVIYMDAAFKARYEILELVHGAYDDATVDFKAYDHYGVPPFSKQDHVMLYLREHDGSLFHVKYQSHAVYPTADGRYAACGNPYLYLEDDDEIDRRPLQEIEFSPPVVFRLSDYAISDSDYDGLNEQERAQYKAEFAAEFSHDDFDISGDRAICQRGVYPQELFRIMNESLFLPTRRREICEERHGVLNEYYPNDSDEAKAVKACIAEMKRENLP